MPDLEDLVTTLEIVNDPGTPNTDADNDAQPDNEMTKNSPLHSQIIAT